MFKRLLICALFFIAAVFCKAPHEINQRPIIGILSQPIDDPNGSQYIAASYVKWAESAGARVVPILYTWNTTYLEYIFSGINGLLFPGGGVDLSGQYLQTLQFLWNSAIKANEQGDYFPVWGTCFGFQEISMMAANNLSLLTGFNSENYTVPLSFTNEASSSRLFGNAPNDVISILQSQPVTMNNHMWGVSPQSFAASSLLTSFYNVLSTNVDRDGNTFISTIEAIDYPIYGSQWHPEKPLFEWNIHEVINHSTDSIVANQYTNDYFVKEARKNAHQFPTVEEETAVLIYQFTPVYTYNDINDFEQCYFW